jgi:Abortive infection C-terminus
MSDLRYSDRRRLAEAGTLGDLSHELIPGDLGSSVRTIIESADQRVKARFYEVLTSELNEHFGRDAPWYSYYSGGIGADAIDTFLDAIEVLVETASKTIFVTYVSGGIQKRDNVAPLQDIESRINRAFQRFRFGYKLQDGKAHKIGSPALEVTIVGPALLAIQRPGWEAVERSFREAVEHQRGREIDDALTAANAAVEAALKAIGMKGSTLKQLAQSFRGSGIVPGYLENVPELLEDLLDRLHALRSQEGDAHGKGPGTIDPEEALADLAVHLAGSFIVYLANVAPVTT